MSVSYSLAVLYSTCWYIIPPFCVEGSRKSLNPFLACLIYVVLCRRKAKNSAFTCHWFCFPLSGNNGVIYLSMTPKIAAAMTSAEMMNSIPPDLSGN